MIYFWNRYEIPEVGSEKDRVHIVTFCAIKSYGEGAALPKLPVTR